jgi:hypothetical protein
MATPEEAKTKDGEIVPSSSGQLDTVVRQKIADWIKAWSDGYIQSYGCYECWADVRGCSCKPDKRLMKKFVDAMINDITARNFSA